MHKSNGLRIALAIIALIAALFASPAMAKDLLPRRPYLGCQLSPVSDSLRMAAAVKFEGGVLVGEVKSASSAEKGGLKVGDILLTLDGQPVADVAGWLKMQATHHSGDRLKVELVRGLEKVPKTLTLQPYPKETDPSYDVQYETVTVHDSLRRMIITKPKGKGIFPVIFFVGGIGCYSLDLPPGTPHAYLTILHELASNGFVTVRVEKSGMGDSQGPPCAGVDFNTELAGYVAGMQALTSYAFMDTSRVILLGHSMGGIIEPLLYTQFPTVKGIITIATSATSWFEYELINQRRQLVLSQMDYDSIEIKAAQKEMILHKLLVEKQTPDDILKDHPEWAEDLQYPCHYSYIQQVAALNVVHDWKAVAAPVLILYGAGDFVTSPEDHEYLRDIIERYHPGNATYKVIPHMDHFFTTSPTCQASFENMAKGMPNREFSSEVLPEILNWARSISSNSKEKPLRSE